MSVETITTVLVPATGIAPAGPYDLTDLATVRDELGFTASSNTGDNPFLQRAITQVSRAIASYCSRIFQAEVVQDEFFTSEYAYPWQIPGGVRQLQLTRWPLPISGVVTFTGNTNGSTVITGTQGTAALTAGAPVFASDGSLPSGAVVRSLTPYSVVLSQPATSKASGIVFTVGVQVVQATSATTLQTLKYGSDFTVDAKHGWLVRLDSWTGQKRRWEAWPTTVQYLGGYQTIPADLVEACLKLVTMRYRTRGRDPTVMERSQPGMVGTERYWVGGTPGQNGQFPPEVEALIDPYRVPVVA